MSNANTGFEHFGGRVTGKPVFCGRSKVRTMLRVWAFSAAVAGLLTFGCGTHATLVLTAPSGAIAGSPFTVTVTAMVGGMRDTIINSPILFTSSDPAAVLPPFYGFNAKDAGSHTFTDGVILMTPGSQSITATIIGAPGINGTVSLTVSAKTAPMQSR